MKSKKKIGILGGTFDPIHYGHLNLAKELKEKHGLDEVWFVPAYVNPLKCNISCARPEHRLAMVKLAIEPYKKFFVKELELNRPPPSYTVDTLKSFKEAEPNNDYFLLLGEDALVDFDKWHQSEEIVKMAPLLVGTRPGKWPHAFKNMTFIQEMDISASDIRRCLTNDISCTDIIPEAVLHYIKQHHLYK